MRFAHDEAMTARRITTAIHEEILNQSTTFFRSPYRRGRHVTVRMPGTSTIRIWRARAGLHRAHRVSTFASVTRPSRSAPSRRDGISRAIAYSGARITGRDGQGRARTTAARSSPSDRFAIARSPAERASMRLHDRRRVRTLT